MGPPAAIALPDDGLTPFWPIADGAISDVFTTPDAQGLLDAFQALVATIADRRSVNVNPVFLDSMMPVPAASVEVEGASKPLTVAQVMTILDIYEPHGTSAWHR